MSGDSELLTVIAVTLSRIEKMMKDELARAEGIRTQCQRGFHDWKNHECVKCGVIR